MKKFLVQEKFVKTNNYIVEANSQEEAEKIVENCSDDLEVVDTDEYDYEVVFSEEYIEE